MKKIKVNNNNNFRWPFCISVLVHGAVIVSLILASPVTFYRLNNAWDSARPIVHASVVLAPQQIDELQNQVEQQKLQEKKKAAQVRVAEIKAAQKLQAEHQKQAQLKAQQAQQQALAQAKAAAQAKALEIKKQQEAAQAKAALEAKKQKELELAKQKQAELHAKQTALQQQIMQEQMANEQAQILKAQQQMQGILDQYRAKILLAIGSQWLIPDGVDPSISCVFTIELMTDGRVAHVQLVKSSGNVALDRAAETAIYKASPLPVPKDPDQFSPFRRFTLKMTPQEIKR